MTVSGPSNHCVLTLSTETKKTREASSPGAVGVVVPSVLYDGEVVAKFTGVSEERQHDVADSVAACELPSFVE